MVHKTNANKFSPFCKNARKPSRPLAVGAHIQQNIIEPTKKKAQILAEVIPGKPSYKTLPSLVGNSIIDSTKRTPPAYSMGRRIARKEVVDLVEDGPAKFDVSGMCNKGPYKAKACLIRSRIPEFKKYLTPGVGEYQLDVGYKATTKCTPQYSFGVKTKTSKKFLTPAPNVYNLPPVVGTAKESNKRAAPAFSILSKMKPPLMPPFITPGPGQYENNINYVKRKSPKYTMRSHQREIKDKTAPPGPSHYCPEKYVKGKSAPAPSFAMRHSSYLCPQKAHLITPCHKALNVM